jgi:hypothetical protein
MRRVSWLSTGRKPHNSRSVNDVARELLAIYRPELTPTVAGWLEELIRNDCPSLIDEAVLRSLAASHGVTEW